MDTNNKIDKIELAPILGVLNLAMTDFEHLPATVWLTLLKIEFKLRKFTNDEVRYNPLEPQLSRQMLLAMQNILLNSPETVKYEAVVQSVLKEAEP